MTHGSLRLHTGTPIPERLIATVHAWDQADVTPGWLESLPSVVADLCARHEITLEPEIPHSYVTLVLLGHSRTLGPVAIKSSPLADEFLAEATALRIGAADNVARLHEVDLKRSAMVIERIVPGTMLRDAGLADDVATRIAAESVASMWRPVADPTGLHPLRRWMRALLEGPVPPGALPPDLVDDARSVALDLLANSTRTCLLHGDFQHHNLLQRTSGEWAIIDPKGLYGDPAYEIAAWMANPPGVTSREDYREIAARRVAIFAEVWGMDRATLAAWAFAGMTLNGVWSASGPAPDEWLTAMIRGASTLRDLMG